MSAGIMLDAGAEGVPGTKHASEVFAESRRHAILPVGMLATNAEECRRTVPSGGGPPGFKALATEVDGEVTINSRSRHSIGMPDENCTRLGLRERRDRSG